MGESIPPKATLQFDLEFEGFDEPTKVISFNNFFSLSFINELKKIRKQ